MASFSRNGTGSPVCAECVWPASRGKPVLGYPPKWLDAQKAPSAVHVPSLTPEQERALESMPKAVGEIRYVSDRELFAAENAAWCAKQQESAQTLHEFFLDGPRRYVEQSKKADPDAPVTVTDLPPDRPASHMLVPLSSLSPSARARVREEKGRLYIRHADVYGALSPRQALGEALACVERATGLMRQVCGTTPLSIFKAGNLLPDVEAELRRAYEAAKEQT